jgi:hypothetical protein
MENTSTARGLSDSFDTNTSLISEKSFPDVCFVRAKHKRLKRRTENTIFFITTPPLYAYIMRVLSFYDIKKL